MACFKKNVHEIGRLGFEVLWHVESSGLVALSQTQDSIDVLRNTVLLRDHLKWSWSHAVLECLQTDLILDRLASHMDNISILNALDNRANLFEVG